MTNEIGLFYYVYSQINCPAEMNISMYVIILNLVEKDSFYAVSSTLSGI
jgi:hypothetical protein